MALARTFARYLASIPRYAVADNRCTRHLILRGVRSRAALAPGLSDTVVDFIVPSGAQELVLIEAKASRTVRPDAARSVLSLAQSISNHQTRCIVVHATTAEDKDDTVLALGARAMSVAGLLHSLRRGLK